MKKTIQKMNEIREEVKKEMLGYKREGDDDII